MWASQYQQSPEPRGGGIIKRHYWGVYDNDLGMELGADKNCFPSFDYLIASLDPAYTEKQENDPSGFVVFGLCRDKYGNPKIILVQAWEKYLDMHGTDAPPRITGEQDKVYLERCKQHWGLVEWVAHECKRLKVDRLLIESRASGITVAQELRRLYRDATYGVQLINPGNQDKVARLWAVQHLFTDGMIYAPTVTQNGSVFFRDWAQGLIDQSATFPKSAHDDMVDAMAQALKYLRDNGLALRRDEHAADEEALKRHYTKPLPLYPV